MASYSFTKSVTADKLQGEIVTAGLSTVSFIETVGDEVIVHFPSSLDSSQQTTLESVIGSHEEQPAPIADVTPRQMRQALVLSGVSLNDIETALNSLSEPTKSLAKIEWEYSTMFQRNRPLVLQVGAMLGWTSQQLDTLWAFAKTL